MVINVMEPEAATVVKPESRSDSRTVRAFARGREVLVWNAEGEQSVSMRAIVNVGATRLTSDL